LLAFPAQQLKQLTYCTIGRFNRESRMNSVPVSDANLGLGNIAIPLEVQDYLVSSPFRYANIITDFPGCLVPLFGNGSQYQGMIGDECPLSHFSAPFTKIFSGTT
jgi:hypothetical protein